MNSTNLLKEARLASGAILVGSLLVLVKRRCEMGRAQAGMPMLVAALQIVINRASTPLSK
jgi:hypothetical protein